MVDILTYGTGIYENDESLLSDKINESRKILKNLGIITGIFIVASMIAYIVIITLAYKSGNENYNITKNCTVIDPLIEIIYDPFIYMRLGKLYISMVTYNNQYTNSTILAETMTFSIQEFYLKYNYTKNDNVTCYISKENYFTVYYYKTSVYSNDKITYIFRSFVIIIGMGGFIGLFIIAFIMLRKKIINFKKNQNDYELNYQFNYNTYQNVL